MKIVFFLPIFLTFVFSCKNHYYTNCEIKTIDVESNLYNYSSMLLLADVASDIQYVTLGRGSECMIDEILYVDISENHILVKAKNGIFLFTKNGEFLREISHKGKGPFEYILSAIPRMFNDSIFIPTLIPGGLFVFDLNGNPVSSINLPWESFNPRYDNWFYEFPHFILQVPNASGKEKYRLIKVDINGDTVKTYRNTTFFNGPSINRAGGTMITSNQFYSFNNSIRYKEQLNDTLWQLTDTCLAPLYVFKRGRFGVPNEYRGLPLEEYQRRAKDEIAIARVLESEDYVFYKIRFNNYPFDFYRAIITDVHGEHKIPCQVLGCYNKKTKQTFIVEPTSPGEQIEPTGIHNDFDGGINFLPKSAINENEFVSWFEAHELKKYIATQAFKTSTPKYPEKKRELEKLANGLTDNDNPVLMLVKLKE
jgi:hypothetical protein